MTSLAQGKTSFPKPWAKILTSFLKLLLFRHFCHLASGAWGPHLIASPSAHRFPGSWFFLPHWHSLPSTDFSGVSFSVLLPPPQPLMSSAPSWIPYSVSPGTRYMVAIVWIGAEISNINNYNWFLWVDRGCSHCYCPTVHWFLWRNTEGSDVLTGITFYLVDVVVNNIVNKCPHALSATLPCLHSPSL